MLVITRRTGQAFLIGSNIEIIISDISKDQVRISVDAPKEIPIVRKELIEAKNANLQASCLVEDSAIHNLKINIKKGK